MNTLGEVTKTKFLKLVDGTGAIYEGFVAKTDLVPGQQVKLEGTTGKVEALAKADNAILSVGTVIKPALAGEYVTVQTKFKSIVFGTANANMNAGPVALEAYNSGIPEVTIMDVAHPEYVIGYNLAPALADAEVTLGLI